MRRTTTLAVTMTTALLLGTACGDDGATDDEAAAATSIEVTAEEFSFSPTSWTVPAGEEFDVELTNAGEVEHEWAVIKQGEDIEAEDEFAEDKVLFEVEAIPAGESTTESHTVDDAGTYQVICALPGHFDAGMEGTLEVTG